MRVYECVGACVSNLAFSIFFFYSGDDDKNFYVSYLVFALNEDPKFHEFDDSEPQKDRERWRKIMLTTLACIISCSMATPTLLPLNEFKHH